MHRHWSDGAAAVIVMERKLAESLGYKPLLRFVGYNVGGVRPGDHGRRSDQSDSACTQTARDCRLTTST